MAFPVPDDDQIFITPADIRKRYGNFSPNIFKHWQDNQLARKLRNGLYLNDAFEVKTTVDEYMIANELYEPSYVSLHSALNYYGLIPEFVIEVISVTTKKTKFIQQGHARYRYHTLKPELFWGYENVPWHGGYYSIAYPEKALLDLAYLEPLFSDRDWIEEMRFDPWGIKEDLNWDRMMLFAYQMKSEVVMKRIALLLEVFADD
jgi:predicted transcriptional regulator of viral defense system